MWHHSSCSRILWKWWHKMESRGGKNWIL